MKRTAFFDIDGTLINVPAGMMSPSSETVRVLKKFQNNGNEIFLATARGKNPIDDSLIPFDGFIGNDGHYITYHNEVILDDLFDEDEVKCMIDAFEKYNGRAVFSGHDNSWCSCWNDEYVQKHAMMFAHSTKRPENLIEQFEAQDIHALACCVLFENVEDLLGCYRSLEDRFTMVKYETGLIRMDVYRKGFEKGSAVKYMYEKLGYEKENTWAFGDGVNDIVMMKNTGHGIAMGNGVPEIREAAEHVTDSVMDDGIARYFDAYMNR